jgi:hypothetical protein
MVHVKAHTGGKDWQSRWNDAADALAKAAATSAEQPPLPAPKPSNAAAPAVSAPADHSSFAPSTSLLPTFLPPPSHSLLPPPRIVDSRPRPIPRKRVAPDPAPAAAPAVAQDDLRSFGSDDDLGAAVEAMSGGRGGKSGGRGAVAKKPFYNKAYASKFHWRGKAKRAEGAPSGGGRGFSSSSRGHMRAAAAGGSGRGRGGAGAAVDARQGRSAGDWVDVPMYSDYGEAHYLACCCCCCCSCCCCRRRRRRRCC